MKLCFYGDAMKGEKVDCLFYSVSNSHVDFCSFLENRAISFLVKTQFDETDFFDEIKIIFVDFSFLCAFDFPIIARIRKKFLSSVIYVISDEDSACFAVQTMKLGADDYLVLPFNERFFYKKIEKYLTSSDKNPSEDLIPEFIGKNPKILEMKKQIIKFASTDLPILILGETGTGKSFLAKLIHKYSKIAENPFCEENMAVIPEPLAESLLFGAKKGIYTGAENHTGLVAAANTGTLFLDEITEASLGIQAKLLRVLSEKLYKPLGGTVDKKADIRLITASNANLQKSIENKTFREDLYYRINTLTVRLPSLSERKDDIPLLIQYFVEKYKKEITFDAIRFLENYECKGNVRELESILKRASYLCSNNTIKKEDLIFC